jgi:hypothetical protein
MTTYTKADLAAKALRLPGLYGPDEAISADDQAEAEEMAEQLIDSLNEMDIAITNGSVDDVPSAWFVPLANFIGVYLLQSFGGPAPTADQIDGATKPLRRMGYRRATGATLKADYF